MAGIFSWSKMANLSVLLVGAIGVTICQPSVARAQQIIKIGEIEAQTGALNTYGWMSSQGVRLAVDQINKAGGFEVAGKKYKFQLINPDTQGNPQQALIQLKQMLGDEHVKFVFGPYLTNVFNGIEPYATEHNGAFLLIGGATAIHSFLGKPNHDYLLRTFNWDSGPNGFGSLMVNDLKQRGAKKVAMLMQNDAFGHVARDIYAPLFKDAGIEFEEEWFEPGTADFSSVLAKIAAGKPDYLFPGYSDAVLDNIIRQATEVGITKFWLIRGSEGPGLKNKDALDDYIVYIPKDFDQAQNSEPKVKKFIADYKAFYKTDFPYDQAPLCVSSCYDHVFYLVEAMKHAGTVDDVAKIKKAFMSFTYSGLWNLRFDSNGEQISDFDVVDIKRGGKVEVQHFGLK